MLKMPRSLSFPFLALFLCLLAADLLAQPIAEPVSAPAGPYVPISVGAARVDRVEQVADVNLDLAALGGGRYEEAILLGRMMLVETDDAGFLIDDAVPFQWDPAPGSSVTVGGLSFLVRGPTRGGAYRHYRLYLAKDPSPASEWNSRDGVRLERIGDYQGEDTWRISTPHATYLYHHQSGGFAGMLDRDGKDWISYRPGNKEKGEYRGIPNIAPPDFHPGRPAGKKPGRVLAEGPLRLRIRAETEDGKWAKDWDIFPTHARMTLFRKGAEPYWILYEGTPGGEFTVDDYWVDSSGKHYDSRSYPQSQKWNGELPSPQWVYFADPREPRVLYLARHEYSTDVNEYWHFGDGGMTVFGFGRGPQQQGWQRLTSVPARLTIGFAESANFAEARVAIESAWRPLQIQPSSVKWATGVGGQ
jgi:hypothetical protein